ACVDCGGGRRSRCAWVSLRYGRTNFHRRRQKRSDDWVTPFSNAHRDGEPAIRRLRQPPLRLRVLTRGRGQLGGVPGCCATTALPLASSECSEIFWGANSVRSPRVIRAVTQRLTLCAECRTHRVLR